MNIKRIMAYGVYYCVWGLVFYGMAMTAIIYSKDYNVNLVCLAIGLVLVFIIEPTMFYIKDNIKLPDTKLWDGTMKQLLIQFSNGYNTILVDDFQIVPLV